MSKNPRVFLYSQIYLSREKSIEDADRCRRERLRDIAILIAETGKGFCRKILYHEYPAAGSHGAEPPRNSGPWHSAKRHSMS